MADNTVSGFGKDPLVTSHGDALADQSFQSLKSKEIRDSLSPTEMKFQSMTLNNPNTTGWNVQSSKEVSPDGRGFRAETLATTDGVESVNGGIAEFKGRNEQLSSAHHQGDDKNFIKKAMESSNSHLQEKVVIGDENSGCTEVRTSSSTSTSSSQVIQSSTNVEYNDGLTGPQAYPQKYLMDPNLQHSQDVQQRQQQEQQRLLEEQRIYEQQFQQQRQQQERYTTEQLSTIRQNTEQKNILKNVETQETHEQNKRFVDMDKASPEYQQQVQYLMQQPGEIISNTVEYPKPNVKMITTVKRLPDGTIVRNKRYETEEMTPKAPTTTRSPSNATTQTQPRHDGQQHPTKNVQPSSTRPNQDMVDSSSHYVQNIHTDDLESKFSSIKKSNRKFATETTSETIHEFDERQPHSHGEPSTRVKSVSNDFSTHGFPSVKPNKPTQEYPSDRPHTTQLAHGLPNQWSPSKPSESVQPHYTDDTDNITERRIPTKDGEVIIVSSEKKRNYKTSTNSERTVETEHIIRDDQPYQNIPDKSQDFTTHGFPSIREHISQQPKNYPSDKNMQPHEQDFPLDKFSPGKRIIKKSSPHGDDDVIVVSSQRSHTAKHSTNTERIIEHEIIKDGQPVGYTPRIQPNRDNSPYNYTVTTPGELTPQVDFISSPRKPSNPGYTSQGFPAVRTPGQASTPGEYPKETSKPDYTTQGFPSVKAPSRPAAGLPSSYNQHCSSPRKSPSHDYSTQGFPSVRSPTKEAPTTQGYPSKVDSGTSEHPRRPTSTTKTQTRTPSPNKTKPPGNTVRETTERVIRKEKEVDSAHRAFAASLRSSSPIDHVRRDSYTTDSHTRHTPRSSVSSSKTSRRDMREGSHDSAPSETSRFSTTTITRNTPPRTVGSRTVVTKVVTTKTGNGSNDSLNVSSPRATKSPSPGKTTTTTTTTRTLTSKDVPKATDNQHSPNTTNSFDSIFPINELPLTTIKLSDNHKQLHKPKNNNNRKKNTAIKNSHIASASAGLKEVIEAPCVKKRYYKLGPSDQQQAQSKSNTNTPSSLKSPQIYEKSPTKKIEPARSSRSSTPSYNSRKPTTVMTDDYDDDDASPLSPSSRSRTPNKISPYDNDAPQDDWQKHPQPDNDERRTVNRKPTFGKTETASTLPRKPNYVEPNIEWIIVDDVDAYDSNDDDNDSFVSEVPDSKVNVKKTTTKLIKNEKQSPLSPNRKPKSTTNTTVITKQFQTKPNDKNPLKTKPNDSRTPQQTRPQKPLTDFQNPAESPSRAQPKVIDNKQITKGIKTTVPSYALPLKKTLPKTTVEETTLIRKTLKTKPIVKGETNKLLQAEKTKRKPLSPERKTKPHTPDSRKPNGKEVDKTITVTETVQKHFVGEKTPQTSKTSDEPRNPYDSNEPYKTIPYYTENEPQQGIPKYKKTQSISNEHTPGYQMPLDEQRSPDYRKSPVPYQNTTGYEKPYETDKEPNQITPGLRQPQSTNDEPHQQTHGLRKPQENEDEPKQGSPTFRKPQSIYDELNRITDDKPGKGLPAFRKPSSPGFQKLQGTFDAHSPYYGKPKETDDEPFERSPLYEKSPDNYNKPSAYRQPLHPGNESDQPIPNYRRPHITDDEPTQDNKHPQQVIEEEITITELSRKSFPEKETPQIPASKTAQHFYDTIEELNQNKPLSPKSVKEPETFYHIQKPEKPVPVNKEHKSQGDEPCEIDDYENLTGFESTTTTQKAVAKHIQKFETNYLKNVSPKPQKEIKSPIRELPQTQNQLPETPNKETSPTRTQRKSQQPPETKPKPGKVVPKKLAESDEDETFVETSEFLINTKQKRIITKREEDYKNHNIKQIGKVPPTQNQRAPSPDKYPTTFKHVSPTRTQTKPVDQEIFRTTTKQYPEENPLDTDDDETVDTKRVINEKQILDDIYYTDKRITRKASPQRDISPARNARKPKEPTRENPREHVSPTRQQNKPEQKLPTDRNSKSPYKSISPTRIQKNPIEKSPMDDETFRTSVKTTKIVTEQKTKQEDDLEYSKNKPKEHKPRTSKPLDKEEITEIRKNSPTPRISEKSTGKRTQSPTKCVSPTRNQKTLRTTENVTEKLIRKVDDKKYPKDTVPFNWQDKPKTKSKEPTKYTDQFADTDDNEVFTDSYEHVTNSTKKRFISEHQIVEIAKSQNNKPQRPNTGFGSPIKEVSPTRKPNQPNEQQLTGRRPQSPNKQVSPKRNDKRPIHVDETLLTSLRTTTTLTKEIDDYKHPNDRRSRCDQPKMSVETNKQKPEIGNKSPLREVSPKQNTKRPDQKLSEGPASKRQTQHTSPTRIQNKPDDENLPKTTLITTITLTGKTTENGKDEEYPDKTPLYPKDISSIKPFYTDEEKIYTQTSEQVISSKSNKITEKIIQQCEKPKSINEITTSSSQQEPYNKRPQSPTKTQKKPNQKLPEETLYSALRTQKKPTDTDKTIKSTLKITKTLVEKPVKLVDLEENPDKQRGLKEPTGKIPHSPAIPQKEPVDEDNNINRSSRTTKTVTIKTIGMICDEDYPEEKIPLKKDEQKPYSVDENETYTKTSEHVMQKSPAREVSPTLPQNKPRQKLPEEPGLNEPLSTRPKSPSRDTDKVFTKTSKTIKIVNENVTTNNEEFSEQETADKKPKNWRPGFVEPKQIRPESPTEDVYISKDKRIFDNDQILRKTLRTTQTVTHDTIEDTNPYKEEPTKYKPKSYEPTNINEDKLFVETTEFVTKSINKPKYPTLKEPYEDNPDRNSPDKKISPNYMRPDFKVTDDKTLTHNHEFIHNTSQQLINTEKHAVETDKDTSPSVSKDRRDLPTRSPSPKEHKPKKTPKDHKPELINPSFSDDDEAESLVIETCEKHFVTTKNTTLEEDTEKFSITHKEEPHKDKPQQIVSIELNSKKPISKPFMTTYMEVTETIEGQTYPEDTEKFPVTRKPTENKKPYIIDQEPLTSESVPKTVRNINEKFIETERIRKESPDGAFISKTVEPSTPTSPTFKKKGAGRRDTFEERCRQILGMDTYGDTPGTFKQQPVSETEEQKKILTEDTKFNRDEQIKNTTVFQVKIEDCDEDDEEPLSIKSVKKTLHKQIHTTEPQINKPMRKEPEKNTKLEDEPEKKSTQKQKETSMPESKKFVNKPKEPNNCEDEFVQTVTKTTTIHKKTPTTKPVNKTEPDSSEPETKEENYKITNKEVKSTKKSLPFSSPRSVSPTKSSTSSRSSSPTKSTSLTKNVSSPKESPTKRKPSKDVLEPKSNISTTQKSEGNTTTIKDRLRSSTRKSKSPAKKDQVDGSDSSPEHSPTRYTERRRSSNISVTTEIIIEHTDSDSHSKKEKSPIPKKSQDSVFKEIIDSTVMPEKLTRRIQVTERKESAPVHRVTNKDKDSKMSRSTSENLIKVKKPEPHSLTTKTISKTTDHRRPNKCFATKSINLSTTDRLVNSENNENVIIDIQHAKSSREPSPDKIVPTPVPAYVDTGKPRYPDVVQEPEDDQPRRKPQVKNIPIFEEENNSFVGCHITEVNIERNHKTMTYDSLDYEEQLLNNPVIEAPPSLDYPSLDKPIYDESLLTVHEKISKFQDITEEKKKPHKNYNEDEEFARNERIYATIKLAPSAPQKSPDLVRTISRHISRQTELDFDEQQPDLNNEDNKDYSPTSRNDDFVECLVNNKKITKEFEVSHRQQQKQTATETTIKKNTAEKYQQPEDHDNDDDDDDGNELIPHTAAHTTIIEERRQKDILSRPSVFDNTNKKLTTSTTATTKTTKTPLKCNKSPVKESEKIRPDNKSRTKPTSAVTNTVMETITIAKQSPQRKNSDIDYDVRGSGVETGVKNIISKQTKVYNNNNNNNSSISGSKTNVLKNLTTSNKKPEKHMPVHSTPAKNSDDYDLSADEEGEMIVTVDETTDVDIEMQVVKEDLNIEANKKIPLATLHKKQTTASTTHSSTNSSPTDQPLKPKTKEHVVKLTEKNPLKSNKVTSTTTSIQTYKTIERADDIDETVLEPTEKKPSSSPSKTTRMSSTTTDSVAARRSLFESNQISPSGTPTKRTPLTSPTRGKRPSYMDHTKSSLEHTRRDSLEFNKSNYSRKPYHPEEEVVIDRSSMVKFDVPQGNRATTARATSVTEDINVEEIFELEVLERLLETVQSYEIRRRIRAQIRLVKKNLKNEMISSTTEVTTKTIKTSKLESEEPDTVTKTKKKTKPEIKTQNQTEMKDSTVQSGSTKKEYIFEEAYLPTSRRSPKPNRYPYEEEKEAVYQPSRSKSPQSPVCKRNAVHERQYESIHHSPERKHKEDVMGEHSSRTTKQQYYFKDEHEHEQLHEVRHETSPFRKSPTHSIHSSPERRQASPESHKPVKGNERSRSPQNKAPKSTRVATSHSPDTKISSSATRKSSATFKQEQHEETFKSSSTKPQMKRLTTKTTTITKSKPEDKTPVWADRKNILKAPSSTTPKKPASSSTLDSKSGYSKTMKSTTSQKTISNKSSFVDNDCVTSSYGIGPTDENGLPLFGIRALKKKKPTMEPSETTEEVTGYVVEEKYYSDNRTKPTVERKEFIYSTNPEELQKLKHQVEETTSRKALEDVEVKETRQTALISKGTPALRGSPEDDFLDSTTKYVRRGSVKEMSEKFIQKESSSAITESKSNNYPKAGLILRTNSRKNSRDVENENENFDSYKTARVQQHHTTSSSSRILVDSDDADEQEHEQYEVEEVASCHSGRFITESESECDSIKTQREFKKVTSSSSSSMATRSFLNSKGEEKIITNVSECLERMHNADNVVEEGDTTEDQEARALLNKFLGASIIMKGVESSLPAAAPSNRQSKIITTTTTSSNLNDDNDGDNNAKHEVKTTRITKTIKSGNSSTPVTYTTCDIEEIWDEEILKELLEQARTYEERRKIRSRLRELMADREETKKRPTGEKETAAAANVPEEAEEEENSASEYEEIIEEVTDYSESESEVDDKHTGKVVVVVEKFQEKEKTSETVNTTAAAKSEISSEKPEPHTDQVKETVTTKIKTDTETVEEVLQTETLPSNKNGNDDKTDSSEKGESLKLMVHSKQKTPQTMLYESSSLNNPLPNSQKLKSAQTSSNISKTTVNQGNSMQQVPCNSNKTHLTAVTSSQNPIVTVQTTGRADYTSLNNNKNSSRQMNSNNRNIKLNNCNNNNNDSGSSSSLGGSNVVIVGSSDIPRQVDRLGVPQKEDSGTESGEDLRLIAAGLRDQLQIQSDSNIIEDVTCALSRLENSLKEGKDISVDTEKRKALLALVARLRAGLTSPEKLAEIAAAMSELDGNEGVYDETSSPEADGHRSNRSRFAKRRNRISRHTVGVSREELADARRYMEDMLIMNNISQCNTPETNSVHNNSPPQWYPLQKNASSGAILTQTSTPVLQRPNQFVSEEPSSITKRLNVNNGKRRPLSGEYSVTFKNPTVHREPESSGESPPSLQQSSAPEDNSKFSRFTNKKHLMKRANTIDLAKTHKYNPEFDTDSDAEDKGPHVGLKRAVQVSIKKRVQNVVPRFEPKTENDRKFLAFINKQSDKPGLGWTNSRSVSNWTNKFGSIKSTFEGGLAGKPPQPPHHVTSYVKTHQSNKLFNQPMSNSSASVPAPNYITNQQIALRLQQEAERQAEERRKKLERERLEYERRERDKLERQRQQRERQERERMECEHFERQRREQDKIAAEQHAAILREQNQLTKQLAKQPTTNINVPKPILINEFKHAPQSVFRPIDNVDTPPKPIYKPIPQLPRNLNHWQSLNSVSTRGQGNNLTPTSPSQYSNSRPDNSFITSPPPSSRSPIALPWASKPTVDNSAFKSKANRFEERSKYDNISSSGPYIQRHNSLRSSYDNQTHGDYKKRPSLPNTADPYSVSQIVPQQNSLDYLPPPQNISFTYRDIKPKTTYQSYPCLPSAMVNNSNESEYRKSREDSLTDPYSVPLVLTSSNPSYCPAPQAPPQQQLIQTRLPRQFDLVSPADSAPTSPSIYTMAQTDCTDDDLDSDNNLLEYHAVSRVMGKPKSQTAVTIGRRTGHVSDDELYGKNSKAAKSLLNTMKSLGNSSSISKPKAPAIKRQEAITSRRTCLSPDGLSYQAPIVEPLFPEINKFESNRSPIYMDKSKKSAPTSSTYSQPTARKQLGMHKSMENLRNQSSFITMTTQPASPKPYVSETQTSYVVTFPIEDTTDNEDLSRRGQKKKIQANSLDFNKQRNVSENSTGSSSTASISYNQNLPSPNTSWTYNPIVADESSNYQNMSTPYQSKNKILAPTSAAEPTYQAPSSQVLTSYSSVNQNSNYNPPSTNYLKKSAQCEERSSEQILSKPAQQQVSMPMNSVSSTNQSQQTAVPTIKSSYEAKSQRQLQQEKQKYQNENKQNQTTTKPSHGAQTQQPVNERIQKPPVTQKPTDYPKKILKNITTNGGNSTAQQARSLVSMRKTVSEDHHSIRADQTVINPQHSNISQEMLTRLEQQRERISNEMRRKSLNNTLDFQVEKQARLETQQSHEYKSSAPSDTPDIVKSSLPKDESQPILKKFGPPQRHHYMPNSYQSPNVKATSSSVVTNTTHSTKIQGKSVHSTSNQTVVKTSQQILNNTRPTIMETPATPQPDDDYIPRNIVYNNVHAFTSMNRRQEENSDSIGQDIHQAFRPNKLSKSDSWNQIMMLQNQHVVSSTPKFNQSPTNELRRTKSGHTLALPKMYEAAITKTDISEKQKTVAAYFSGQKSPTNQETIVEQTTKRSVINRTKTSEKVSAASRKSLDSNLPITLGSLQRSATMPHIANLNLLDESNVEDAFEQLIMEQKQKNSSTSTTEKTETKEKDGAVVTTTTKVTTRTVTGSAAKPASPFAKFKQLDRQNSQPSAKSSTTPTTIGGGKTASPTTGNQPIFKFTDPALNAKAATVKEQLLQWCQSKTQEYENIEITNFSTSWNNGLAFCALIHHFLPDAFDYSQLTPKNRRKNFELAFTVAEKVILRSAHEKIRAFFL